MNNEITQEDKIIIKVNYWDELQSKFRSKHKHGFTSFLIPNGIFDDYRIAELNSNSFKLLILLLSLCSQHSSNSPQISRKMAARFFVDSGRHAERSLKKAATHIRNLEELQLVSVISFPYCNYCEKKNVNDYFNIPSARDSAAKEPQKSRIKKEKKQVVISEQALELTSLLIDLMLKNSDTARVPKDPTKWSLEFDRLLKKGTYELVEIKHVLEWCQSDSFWKTNILSPSSFIKKFEMLKLQSQRKTEGLKSFAQQKQDRINSLGEQYESEP